MRNSSQRAVAAPGRIALFFPEIQWNDSVADQYPFYVIERLLENGDTEAIRWVLARFDDETIRDVVCRSRKLSRRTARFWQQIFRIPEEQVLCLSKSWLDRPNRFWKH
jgi:hypothetical protein